MRGIFIYNNKQIRWYMRIVEYCNARGTGEVQILYKDRKFQLIPHLISLYEDMSYKYLLNRFDNEDEKKLTAYIEGIIEREIRMSEKIKKWR